MPVLTIVDKLPAMLAYWGVDQRCRFANRAYETWFGMAPEALVGRTMLEVLGPKIYALNLPHIEAALLRGEPQQFEREIPDPAGGPPRQSHAHYIPDVDEHGVVRGMSVLVVDETRRKLAEEHLRSLERKLEASARAASLARLAAGIAHEINNPLAMTLGNIDLALRALAGGELDADSTRNLLLDARHGVERSSAIVQSLKLIARADTSRTERVDVNAVVEESLGLTANATRYCANVTRDFGAVGFVEGNAASLAQLFANIVMNAADAFSPETTTRNEIHVSTRRVDDTIIVSVTDNGVGIDESLQARIFEPFFTTKDVGEGRGLGLSIANGIAQACAGSIEVRSRPGHGSTFEVRLPALPHVVNAPSVEPPRPIQPRVPSAASRPKLLLIDDEPALVRVLKRSLDADFDVTVATQGNDAIAALVHDDQPYALVLCDLMMPDMAGPDLFAHVTSKRPELGERFVFMTGGAFTARGRAFLEQCAEPVLEKPFTLERAQEVLFAKLEKLRRAS